MTELNGLHHVIKSLYSYFPNPQKKEHTFAFSSFNCPSKSATVGTLFSAVVSRTRSE